MKKEFDIEKVLMQKGISPNYLVENFGFGIANNGNVTRVYSAPEKIRFGDGLFLVSLIFDQVKLRKVVMMPYIEGVNIPNYPDKNYQSLKMNYCKKILREVYGKEGVLKENGIQWENEYYTIGCYSIDEGKGKYDGGNIIIDIR